METTKLSSKGQIVIPSALRRAHGWKEGQEFDVVDTEEGVLLRPKQVFTATRLQEVAGCLPYRGPARSVEDMEAAIETGVRERWHDRC